jgi:hypothetical protein
MTKITSHLLLVLALLAFCSVPALAQNSHNVWSTKPLAVNDWAAHISYNAFVRGDASFAWTETTVRAYAHAHAVVTPALQYDFMLISVTSTTVDTINGRWNVRRNGVIVCNNCIGKAYILNGAIGDYFKIYVGTPAMYAERWHYSGYITNRFDY